MRCSRRRTSDFGGPTGGTCGGGSRGNCCGRREGLTVADEAAASPFVSRAGAKLAHALDEFKLSVTGLRCADFGCNVGGFTDCMLQRGAASVIAIDTGYGTLAWKL
ncbi:MAG TPA: hypothetical protein DCR70_08340, partial [Phycisphaerales bacterium]|nr:hypothetical protein [Phycisphaerales bacterium]